MKIKEEQLKVIQENQKKLTEIIYEIGVLETTKHGLAHKIADINIEVDAFKEDIETGEYTQIVNEDPQLELDPHFNKVD